MSYQEARRATDAAAWGPGYAEQIERWRAGSAARRALIEANFEMLERAEPEFPSMTRALRAEAEAGERHATRGRNILSR